MLRITMFFLVLFFQVFLFINSNAQVSTGQFIKTYTDRNITSSIYFWVPVDYDSTKTYPFVLAWHSSDESGDKMREFIYKILANNINAILVCPDVNNLNGKSGDYFANLTTFSYNLTRNTYKIDTTKMIIMGYSWGGSFAYKMGLLNPQFFNGIIGLAPTISELDQSMWDNINDIRMTAILGDKDNNFTSVSNLMKDIKNKGANLLYIEKSGVQHKDSAYFNSQAIIDDIKHCYDYITGVTSVNENLYYKNIEMSLSPNPVNDNINISFSNLNASIDVLKIYNSFGDVIKSFNTKEIIGHNSLQISLENYPNGIYYCYMDIGLTRIIKKFAVIK